MENIMMDGLRDDIRSIVREEISRASITNSQNEELLTVKEAAEFLKVSPITIHAWKESGILKPIRINTRIRFRKSDLLALE